MGRETKQADIVVLNQQGAPLIVVEAKVEEKKKDFEQLKSYVAALGASYCGYVTKDFWKSFVRSSDGVFHLIPALRKPQGTLTAVHPFDRADSPPTVTEAVASPKSKSRTKDPHGRTPPAELLSRVGILGLTRITDTTSSLKLESGTIDIKNDVLASYDQLRKRAIRVGIVLGLSSVDKQDWDIAVGQLFQDLPAPRKKQEHQNVIDFVVNRAASEEPAWLSAEEIHQEMIDAAKPVDFTYYGLGRVLTKLLKDKELKELLHKKKTKKSDQYLIGKPPASQ